MRKVVNIIAEKSNVGKTVLMEGIIKELVGRGVSVGTIKHDIHGFDIDYEGKDTYRHRQAGADTVIISSKNRIAIIKEIEEEISIEEILKLYIDKEIVLIEGYKNSKYNKIEVYRKSISSKLIANNEELIAIATDDFSIKTNAPLVEINDYNKLADIILRG